jgi:chemotaxis protein MotB
MAASKKFVLTALGLVLVLGMAAPDPATAQEAAPQTAPQTAPQVAPQVAPGALSDQEPVAVDHGEIDALLKSIRIQVDEMNATAADTDTAMAFLSNQVEAAIRKLSTNEFETEELRETTRGLSDELEAVADNRDQLGFQLTRLTEEKDEIFLRLQGQVRDLATLLSLEREVAADLRKNLDDRSGELRASMQDRDRTAADLNLARETLIARQAQSEGQLQRLAALEGGIAELRDDRAVLETRLTREAAVLESTRASLDDARDQNQALDRDLSATTEQSDGLKKQLSVSNSQIDKLVQELVELRVQITELNGLLENSEGQTQAQQVEIADLGRRLNVALASKVRELARYRSEFLGRLREALGDRADVRVVGDRFVFQSEVLFATGESELEAPGRDQLLRLAESLKQIGATIPDDIDWVLRVDGHTDERPIQTPRFPSNWELSTARAISVVKFLIEGGVPAERVMAAGFAHFRPLDPGGGEAAFRRNRRIEFRLTQK